MMENEAQTGSQKRIFRMAARTLLVSVDCVLYILKPYYAYEKCSPDVGDSNDMKKSDIRRVNRIICKEKVIFIDFQKNDTPISEVSFSIILTSISKNASTWLLCVCQKMF